MADVEDVKRAVQFALKSVDFKDVLDEVYASKPGGLTPDYTTEVYTCAKYNPQTFPCAEISVTVSRNNSQDSELKDLTHEAGVFIHVRGDDEEETELRVNRYLMAVREFFRQYPYLAGVAAQPILVGDDNYSPFVPVTEFEGRPFIKSGLVTLYIRTIG